MRICRIVLGTFAFMMFFVNASYGQIPKKLAADYELVWQDEFEGSEIDLEKWEIRFPGSVRGNATVRKDRCFLDGEGHLIIEAVKEDSSYFTGMVGTEKTYQVQFGYFECRVKLINQVGSSCSFWLQSSTFGKYIGDPAKSGTEIDIFEYRRKYKTNEVHHTIHWDGYKEQHQQHGNSPIRKGIDDGEFHTFGLEWTENKYTFYVDGKKSWSTSKSVSQIEQYIILSLEMNNWSGDPSNSTYPDKAIYDYVRVYQKR